MKKIENLNGFSSVYVILLASSTNSFIVSEPDGSYLASTTVANAAQITDLHVQDELLFVTYTNAQGNKNIAVYEYA